MSKNKRMIILLVAMLAIFSLIGCSNNEANEAKEEPNNEVQSEVGNETAIDFPNKSIKVIVPYNAGGSADLTTRLACKVAEEYLGQPIIIENRSGGGGVTGQSLGAKADPDGYTLTEVSSSVILNPLTKKVDYTADSFDYIANMCSDSEMIFIKKDAPFDSFETFVEYAKANPGKVRVGNGGTLNSDHLSAIMVEDLTGIEVTHVPFEGGAKSEVALLGGHIDCIIGNPSDLIDNYKNGEVGAIAIMSEERNSDYPDVPTFKEKGFDLVQGPFRAIAAPKGTPKEIIDILEVAFLKALSSDELIAEYDKAGIPSETYLDAKGLTERVEFIKEKYAEIIASYDTN